jgi:hypothetical protein
MKMSDQVFFGKEGKPKAIFGECEAARIVEKLLSEDESKSINGFLQQCWFLVHSYNILYWVRISSIWGIADLPTNM